ncbi:MAG: GTP 3',8-cyclase MoaA [Chitinophagales bacterium]|nr:GTP 3',8-cyclase MoaA [Chitinophagales bacterium]
MLLDNFHRNHNYLRISLTDNCNFRCTYCMPDEDMQFHPEDKLMQADEIFSFAKIFTDLGVNKIRLTGGEPLVRKDAEQIITQLATLKTDLSITTNAFLVDRYISTFQKAGMRSLNVSLDTLDADKFAMITRRNKFNTVWNNIELLLAANFHVKLNCVVMHGVNDAEINDFVQLTKNLPLHIRFIEFMPFTGNHWQHEKVFTYHQMLETIANEFEFIKLQDGKHDTAKKYKVLNHAGTFAVISTMSAHFCSSCNRMRLTADGKMKNCLFSKTETDLLSALRNGEDIESLIRKNILDKKEMLGGQFTPQFQEIDAEEIKNRSMISIGG